MPKNFKSTGMTLAVFMYILSGEGLHENEGWAVGVVLIVTIILLNTIATLIEYMFTHKNKIKKHTRSSNAVTEK